KDEMLNLIRTLLGMLIAAMNWLTSPKPLKRTSEAQARVDHEASRLALYQFEYCPFCIKVRRSIRRLGLKIELRDAKTSPHREELIQSGGDLQVPCLKITESAGDVKWLYESDEIIKYLNHRFTAQ